MNGVLTIGQIRNGIERLTMGKRRTRLESWLTQDLRERFLGRILPVDEAIAERSGALSVRAARKAGLCRWLTDCLLPPLCAARGHRLPRSVVFDEVYA